MLVLGPWCKGRCAGARALAHGASALVLVLGPWPKGTPHPHPPPHTHTRTHRNPAGRPPPPRRVFFAGHGPVATNFTRWDAFARRSAGLFITRQELLRAKKPPVASAFCTIYGFP